MANNEVIPLELLQSVISIAVPALSGMLGVAIGSWLTSRRERVQRRHDFIEKQLRQLYSPMLGLHLLIKTRSRLRSRASEAANLVWQDLCREMRERSGIEGLEQLQEKRFPEFQAMIDYNNQQLTNILMPQYREMLRIFSDNMWLADAETRVYFKDLLAFVELWDRWLDKSIPGEVVMALDHSEEKLHPFYKHLQDKHDSLRQVLADGKSCLTRVVS